MGSRFPKWLAWLTLSVVLAAQSITTIQGTDNGTRRLVLVDSQGRLVVSASVTPSGSQVVIGPNAAGTAPSAAPVLVAGYDGTLVRRLLTDTAGRLEVNTSGSSSTCNLSAPVIIAATGSTSLVGLSGSTQIRVCHLSFSGATSADVVINQGTGSACATGTAAMSGTYQDVTGLALDFASPLVTSAGQALCLSVTYSGGGAYGGGVVIYSQS